MKDASARGDTAAREIGVPAVMDIATGVCRLAGVNYLGRRPTQLSPTICVLRSLYRQRGTLLKSQARDRQHMQKAITQMNVQLTSVLSDIVGETGQKILRAIVAGERDGQVLGSMKNVRIRASVDEIARSLQGNWRVEHLFALKQALGAFDFVGTQLAECDHEIELQLQGLALHDGSPAEVKKRGRERNAPKFDLRTHLFQRCGVDLTHIDGIDVTTAWRSSPRSPWT